MLVEKWHNGYTIIMADSGTSEVVIRLKESAAIELRDRLNVLLLKKCSDCHWYRSKFVTQGKTCYKKGIDVGGNEDACTTNFKLKTSGC